MPENLIPKIEQEPAKQPEKKLFAFNYKQAELLAQEKIALEGATSEQDKIKRAALKRQINQLYGKAEDETPMRQIFGYEVSKQRLETARKKIIKKLDKGESVTVKEGQELELAPKARKIQYNDKTGLFSKSDKRGEEIKASFADLITDINWGNYYELDDSVPMALRKKYYEAYYQAQIDDYADQQKLLQRITLELNPLKSEGLIKTYQIIEQRIEQKMRSEHAGLLFEKMINNILKKIALDLPGWGLKIDRATIVEDVEEKIDFLIEFEADYRGVNVEDTDIEAKGKPLGIQFTIISEKTSAKFKTKERQVAEKKKELKKVKDLILISVPIKKWEIFEKYDQWQNQGEMPGGPENLFEPEQIIYFMAQILQETDFTEKDDKGNIVLKEKYKKDLQKYFRGKM